VAKEEAGTYNVTVDNVSATLTVLLPTLTPVITPTPTPAPVVTQTPTPTPTPTPEPAGFEVVIAIAGLLAVAYILMRKGWRNN